MRECLGFNKILTLMYKLIKYEFDVWFSIKIPNAPMYSP